MTKIDIIVDLQYGDCGKGKVAHYLCKTRNYTHVLRYNGGGNAGHTIFDHGKKFVTHQVPVGVFFGVRSVIGPGCVVDPEALLQEIRELESGGIKAEGMIFVAKNAHVVTAAHKAEDGKDAVIGTTKRGIGPAYRDKYARVGMRAEHVKELSPYLVDMHEEFHDNTKPAYVLAEGAQGFGLDVDWGDYPFVTSSHCTTAGALLNGFAPQTVGEVWGIAKIYETYVGQKQFEPAEPVFQKIREYGEEYGATTGRPRQCNWMDMDILRRAVRVNGVTHVVFSKVDILRKVGEWKVRTGGKIISFAGEDEMKNFIRETLAPLGVLTENIYFSENKEGI